MPSRERVITVIIDSDSENDETNIVSEVIDFTDDRGNVEQKEVSKLSSLLQVNQIFGVYVYEFRGDDFRIIIHFRPQYNR